MEPSTAEDDAVEAPRARFADPQHWRVVDVDVDSDPSALLLAIPKSPRLNLLANTTIPGPADDDLSSSARSAQEHERDAQLSEALRKAHPVVMARQDWLSLASKAALTCALSNVLNRPTSAGSDSREQAAASRQHWSKACSRAVSMWAKHGPKLWPALARKQRGISESKGREMDVWRAAADRAAQVWQRQAEEMDSSTVGQGAVAAACGLASNGGMAHKPPTLELAAQ